jgi:hypothetical protein
VLVAVAVLVVVSVLPAQAMPVGVTKGMGGTCAVGSLPLVSKIGHPPAVLVQTSDDMICTIEHAGHDTGDPWAGSWTEMPGAWEHQSLLVVASRYAGP